MKRDLTSGFGPKPVVKKALELTFAQGDQEAFDLVLNDLVHNEKIEATKEELLAFQSLRHNVWKGIVDWRKS